MGTNALASLYSFGDTLKRKLRAALSNPVQAAALGVTRFGEDQAELNNLRANAYPMPGERSVMMTPEGNSLARAALADKGAEMALGAVTIGRPVKVFHGTKNSFSPELFDLAQVGKNTKHASSDAPGMWTTRSPKIAEMFINKNVFDDTPISRYGPRGAGVGAIGFRGHADDGGNIMPMKTTLKNPLVLNGSDAERLIFGSGDFRDGGEAFADVAKKAIADGHDGIIIKANPRGSLEFRAEQYLMFDPKNQVKSTFDKGEENALSILARNGQALR